MEIIAVADEERLKRFVQVLNVKAETPFEPHVEDMQVEDCEPEEDFTAFSVDYGYDMSIAEREMLERSEIGILAFSWMGKFLAGKMDKGFAELKEEIRATREELKDEIRATREELGGKLDESVRRTEEFHA